MPRRSSHPARPILWRWVVAYSTIRGGRGTPPQHSVRKRATLRNTLGLIHRCAVAIFSRPPGDSSGPEILPSAGIIAHKRRYPPTTLTARRDQNIFTERKDILFSGMRWLTVQS